MYVDDAAAVPAVIPKSFNLMGHTIVVKRVPAKTFKEKNLIGYWNPTDCTISLLDSLPDQRMQHTFCHELTHAILDYMNHDLGSNEAFVDTFAGLLHQAWTTIK